jgi:hypothetical protein
VKLVRSLLRTDRHTVKADLPFGATVRRLATFHSTSARTRASVLS